jgi:DNA-binding transcriptional ArsR family regulator
MPSAWFRPPVHNAAPPSLTGVLEGQFPRFSATMRRCDSLPFISQPIGSRRPQVPISALKRLRGNPASAPTSSGCSLTTPPLPRRLNQMVHYRSDGDIDLVSAAISDPTRRAILERLARGPARISDVAASFPMSLTGFSKHVKVLERSGLVRRTRHGRENTLHLQPEPLRAVARWILRYEPFWTERLDRLEAFFTEQKEEPS